MSIYMRLSGFAWIYVDFAYFFTAYNDRAHIEVTDSME
jgi:hypothetical protein